MSQVTDKHKRIYCVYCANDGKLHVEDYPVDHINEEWVYYVRGKDRELVHVPLGAVYDFLPEESLFIHYFLRHMDTFAHCWNPVSRKRLDDLEILFRHKALQQKVESLEIELECVKSDIAQAQQRYEVLKKEYQNTVELFENESRRFNKVEGGHFEA